MDLGPIWSGKWSGKCIPMGPCRCRYRLTLGVIIAEEFCVKDFRKRNNSACASNQNLILLFKVDILSNSARCHSPRLPFFWKCFNTKPEYLIFHQICINSRMVVLFEDCCKKVELHLRYIKLQRILMEKIFELRSLEYQEKRVMKGG